METIVVADENHFGDGKACMNCGLGGNVVKHHISYGENRTVDLCRRCHTLVHKGRLRPDLRPSDRKGGGHPWGATRFNEATVLWSLRLPVSLVHRLEERGRLERQTVSYVLREAAADYLEAKAAEAAMIEAAILQRAGARP